MVDFFSDEDGQTPLHIAAEWGKADCVYLLLTNGANIDAKTRDGHDVFWFAKDKNCKIVLDEFTQQVMCAQGNESSSFTISGNTSGCEYKAFSNFILRLIKHKKAE